MNIKPLIFFIGLVLIFLKWKNFIFIENIWIVACFFVFFVLSYRSIHNRNKQDRKPKPVFITSQN